MKKLLLSIGAVACSLLASAQTASLTFQLKGLTDGQKVGLILIDGNNSKPTFEAVVKNGRAMIDVDIPDGRGFYASIDGKYTDQIIVLNKAEKAIVSATATKSGERYTLDGLTITGSPTYDRYLKQRVDYSALNEMYDEYHRLPVYKDYEKAYIAKNQKAIDSLRATDAYKEFEKAEKAFFTEVERQYKGAQERNADNWFGPFFMLTNYSYLTADQLVEWEKFSPEVQQSFYGKITHDLIVPPSEVGKKVGNFQFVNHADKKASSLVDVLKDNRYVLIDFWASWCRPCRAEIPNVKANYNKYHSKGFDVISVSADRKETEWLKALDEEKLPWWNFRDADNTVSELYKIQYYPTIYLVDSEGIVVAKDIRGEELGKKLEELFKQ
ncbi:MAG: AhpC/TSA family protein [Bacteroidaceae bacterium]|nr:AhpC/TSA family protein [Bacteroidaceae bacterium]